MGARGSQGRMAGGYTVRPAAAGDCAGARSVMLDTFYREFDYGYVPAWHADVVDVEGVYVDDPRHRLIVALWEGEVVGTAGVLSRGPAHPPHPRWLAERYAAAAQLVRVYVRPGHRRQGLARAMVRQACEFAAATEGYDCVYLHTNVDIPGAQGFWNGVAKEVFDARPTGEHGPGFATVHYEIPLASRV